MAGLIQKSARRFTTQIGATGVADNVVTTIPLVSVTGLPTNEPIELIIDRSDSSGILTPNKEEVVRGTISGTNLINCTRGVEGTAQAHSAGATVNALLTASMWNNMSQYIRDMPSRGLIGGIIQPTVASNNLTVAIKTLAGNDPSVNEPVYVWINNTLRSITSALSTTLNAGSSWLNMGSAELATKETDIFVYMQWDTVASKVQIFLSRIPYGRLISDFNVSGTNERGAPGHINFTTTNDVVNVGRFAATLSAGAGHTWTVPTFDNANLIQEPIYETRRLEYTPTVSSSMGLAITAFQERSYIIQNNTLDIFVRLEMTTSGAAAIQINCTMPISAVSDFSVGNLSCNRIFDATDFAGILVNTGVANSFGVKKYNISNWGIGVTRYFMVSGTVPLN